MPTREIRYAMTSWMASLAVHLGGWFALAWSLANVANPQFSLDSSPHSGEFSSLMTSAAVAAQAAEAVEITPPDKTEIAELPEPVEIEPETPPPVSAAWADDRTSHRPIVVRERLPRTIAMADLIPLKRQVETSTPAPTQHPKDLPPICQELWRRTTDLPKQIDFDAVEKLLQKVSAPTVAVIETEAAMPSQASVQGTKVDAIPKPGPRNKPPAYPTAARLAGQAGRVLLTVVVAVDGSAKDMRLAQSSGHPALDEAALTAVRAWRFEPAKRNGVAVELEIDVPIRFRLTP